MKKHVLSAMACIFLVASFALVREAQAQDADLVAKVQQALKDRGFDPGPVDGIMGPRTSKAIRDFQVQKDIQVTGSINDETLDALGLKSGGVFGRVKDAGDTVAGAAVTAGKATAKAGKTAAEATAKGATTAAKATAKGADVAADATVKGAGAVAKGASTGAKATASGATKGGKATVSGVSKGTKAARGLLPGGKNEDQALAQRVRERLVKDPGVNADHLEVQADGANVYLVFSGGDSSEWNRAVSLARKVDGVDNVFIRMPE